MLPIHGCGRCIWANSVVKPVLALENINAGYGSTQVLEGVSLSLQPGEAISVMGRNGVGKTTLLATIMGQTRIYQGELVLDGDDIKPLHAYERVWRGLGYVPQEREIFPSLSVQQNLAVAECSGVWTRSEGTRSEGTRSEGTRSEWTQAKVFELFPQLWERRANLGHQLSGGEQQMLAIGRALVGNPRVLLLDEPSEGLAPVIVEQLQVVLQTLRDQGSMAMILVEQNSRVALDFAPRCLVMNRGRIVFDGASRTLIDDRAQLDALVGVSTSVS